MFKFGKIERTEIHLGDQDDPSGPGAEDLFRQAVGAYREVAGGTDVSPRELRRRAQQAGGWPMKYDIAELKWSPQLHQLFLGVEIDTEPRIRTLDLTRARPLLVTGESHEGRRFLQSLVESVVRFRQSPLAIGVSVITLDPRAWSGLKRWGITDIVAAYEDAAEAKLNALAAWEHSHAGDRGPRQRLLIFDGLSSLGPSNFSARDNLRQILNHGPRHHLYTAAAGHPGNMGQWGSYFGERVESVGAEYRYLENGAKKILRIPRIG